MGRKNSNKNKQGSKANKSGKTYIILGSLFSILTVAFLVNQFMSSPKIPIASATGVLIENRPVLTPALFSGKAAYAYKLAAEIPKIIDSQFCYCYCKKHHGHKTLLTCFTSMHGSKCDVCMDEVIYAYELYKDGKSADEIVVAIDKKFYRPDRSHKI